MTLFWYDIETFGTHPAYDKIAQFAGIRTDDQFNEIEEPFIRYCKITPDYIPDPMACLVTGISPQETLLKGQREYWFAKDIFDEFMRPGQCIAGFNNLRFDDEFIRHLFYRNFFEVYSREYKNNSSRWDIIDLVRAAHDLRPEGINWVYDENGRPVFKLEELSKANNIEHANAHDAVSDVRATIALAKLVHDAQPKLFKYLFHLRNKNKVKELINIHDYEPVVHTSGMFTSPHGCTSIVAPIGQDPSNQNLIISYDLRYDPEDFLKLPVEEIKKRIFTRSSDLQDERIHLKGIQLNKSPVVAPLSILSEDDAKRLNIDVQECMNNFEKLRSRHDLQQLVREIYSREGFDNSKEDPENQLYSSFISDEDNKAFKKIHNMEPGEIAAMNLVSQDSRVAPLFWRFKCRNFPEHITAEEAARWKSFCSSRLLMPPGNRIADYKFVVRKIQEKLDDTTVPADKKPVLVELKKYADRLERDILSRPV